MKPKWWGPFATVAPALLGLGIVLNETLIHRADPNPSLIGTGLTLMGGSLLWRATNGNGK